MKIKDVFHINKLVMATAVVLCISIFYAASILRPVSLTVSHNYNIEKPYFSLSFAEKLADAKPIVFTYQNKKVINDLGEKRPKKLNKRSSDKKISYKVKRKKRTKRVVTHQRFEVVVPRLKIDIRTDKKFLAYLVNYSSTLRERKLIAISALKSKKLAKAKKVEKSVVQTVQTKQAAVAKKIGKAKDAIVLYDYPKKADKKPTKKVSHNQKKRALVTTQSEDVKQVTSQNRDLLDSIIQEHHQQLDKKPKKVKPIDSSSIAKVASIPLSTSVRKSIESIIQKKNLRKSARETAQRASPPSTPTHQQVVGSQLLASKSNDLTQLLDSQSQDGLVLPVTNKRLQMALMSQEFSPFISLRDGYKAISLTSQSRGSAEIMYSGEDGLPFISLIGLQKLPTDLPEISLSKLEKLMNKRVEHEAFLLIEHIDHERPFDLDGDYVQHIALDRNFNVTTNNIRYELFVGVEPGNRIIRYLTSQKQEVEIIATLTEERITYLPLLPENSFEMNLKVVTYTQAAEMNITQEAKVHYYNKKLNTYNDGNRVSFLLPPVNKNSNDYIRIDYNNRTFYYVAQRGKHQQKVELLDDYSVDGLYEFMDIDNPGDYCVVQYNLGDPIEKMHFNLRDGQRDEEIEAVYLDRDGQFYDEPSASSKMAFVLANRIGTINLDVQYINEKSRVAHTPCQPGSFFIQNL